jgi:hypothetical protein
MPKPLRDSGDEAAAVLDHLGDPGQPATVLSGASCQEGAVTLKYLETLLSVPDR